MGTPYIGHGYLDLAYNPSKHILTAFYSLPWQHAWLENAPVKGYATFDPNGILNNVYYEIRYIAPQTKEMITLLTNDTLFQVEVELSGMQAYGYYIVLVQGYASSAVQTQPSFPDDPSGNDPSEPPLLPEDDQAPVTSTHYPVTSTHYDVLLTRVPKSDEMGSVDLQDGSWKFHWGNPVPTDNDDITVKIASVQPDLLLDRWQGWRDPVPAAEWEAVIDADNLREFGTFRIQDAPVVTLPDYPTF